jgi:phosphate transport system substrate-binding protein
MKKTGIVCCFLFTVAALLTGAVGLRAQTVALPDYVPMTVATPVGATYVQPDGAILIVGADNMERVLSKWNALFERTHPGVHFKLLLKGSSTGIEGLTEGVSLFAPMDREAWESDLRPFRFVYGYSPTDVLVGHSGYAYTGGVGPPGIYVNAANPLAGLTVMQVARIFTSGQGEGDVSHWGQLGVKGEWAARTIHLYGPRDDGGLATSARNRLMAGHAFAERYEPMAKCSDVVRAVSQDIYGIGLVGVYDASHVPPNVRMLPLSAKQGGAFSSAGYEDVMNGVYPYGPACLTVGSLLSCHFC